MTRLSARARQAIGALLSTSALALALPACYGAEPAAASGPLATASQGASSRPGPELGLTAVPFGDPAGVGQVAAVADLDSRVVVFGDRGAIALASGAAIASDDSVLGWSGGASVPAADRTGVWAVGVSAAGALLRFRDGAALENVGARYGLDPNEPVRGVLPVNDASFAAVVDGGFVMIDVAHATTTRFDTGPLAHLSASKTGRVAGIDGDDVVIADVVAGKRTRIPCPGARATAFDGADRLLVASEHTLRRERDGAFDLVLERDDVTFGALASSGSRVWFVAGTELWALEADVARRAPTAIVEDGAALGASSSGDVWLLGASMERYRPQASPAEDAWLEAVQPSFQRVCAACHVPGGSAGIDLSSYAAWDARRDVIRQRVVVDGSMPPPPATLSQEERASIATWLAAR
jgi:mono/diheme cytochrome c family protein